MSRTWKDEHKSDGFHVGNRLERQARPADRKAKWVEANLVECVGVVEDFSIVFEPSGSPGHPSHFGTGYEPLCDECQVAEPEVKCYCRRCFLHDDPGGCLRFNDPLLEVLS